MISIEKDNDIGVTFTLSGPFSFNEVKVEIQLLFASDYFANLKYWLIDRSDVTNYDLTVEQAKELASLCVKAKDKNNSLTHIIVSSTDFEFGMSRLFQAYESESGWTRISFRKIEHARDWINNNIYS